ESCKKTIWAFRCPHPDGEMDIILVDALVFNDTFVSNAQILQNIAECYQWKTRLSGLVYSCQISDNKVMGALLRNANTNIFKEPCGKHSFKIIIFVTKMCDAVLGDI
ncbi:hypothetical protein J3A83DRAFT_4068835, partial [Scleroderma citrinum]